MKNLFNIFFYENFESIMDNNIFLIIDIIGFLSKKEYFDFQKVLRTIFRFNININNK